MLLKKATLWLAVLLGAGLFFGLLLAFVPIPSTYDLRVKLGVWAYNQSYDRLATFLFRLPSQQGYAPALNHLAVLHFDGLGSAQRDRGRSIAYLMRAAEQGYAPAQANLGYLHWHGVNNRLQRDWERTRSLYEAAAAQDDLFGLLRLSSLIMYVDGRGRYRKVVPLLRKAAASNDPEALYDFASHMHYICGDGDDDEACQTERVEAFRRAADQNHAAAQHDLAYLLEKLAAWGDFPELTAQHDPEEFLRLIQGSASAGYVYGMGSLAKFYFEGEGVPRDRQKAADWFEKVAVFQVPGPASLPPRGYDSLYLRPYRGGRSGYYEPERTRAYALKRLGDIYAEGLDVGTDHEKAASYYRRAAEGGDRKAAVSLAKAYLSGLGLPKDQAEAIHWLREAETQGSEEAQLMLTQMGVN